MGKLVTFETMFPGRAARTAAPVLRGAIYAHLSARTRLQSKPQRELRTTSRANQSVRRNLAGVPSAALAFPNKTTGCCSTDTDRGTDERKVLRNSRQRVGGRSHNRGDALVHRVNILSFTKALKIRCNWLIRKVKQPLGLTRRDAAAISEVCLKSRTKHKHVARNKGVYG